MLNTVKIITILCLFAVSNLAVSEECFSVGKPGKGAWTLEKSAKNFQFWAIKRVDEPRYSTVAAIKVSDILPPTRRQMLTPETLKRECDRKNNRSTARIKVKSYESKITKIKTDTGTMQAVTFRFEALDNGPEKVGLIGLASGAKQKYTLLVKGFAGITSDGRLAAVNVSSRRPVPQKIEEDILDEFISAVKIR